jgi:hypothetical protein
MPQDQPFVSRVPLERAHRQLHIDWEALEKRQRQCRSIDRLDLLIDEEHSDGGKELLSAERLDEANEEGDAAVTGDVCSRVGEDGEKLFEV